MIVSRPGGPRPATVRTEIDSRTLSFAARRAGQIAAITPTRAAKKK